MIKTFLKGQYGSNRIVPNLDFFEIFETEKKLEGLLETLFRVLKRESRINRFVLDMSETENLFDKILKTRITWVKPFCSLIKIC